MFAYTKLMQAMAAAGVVSATDPYFNLTTLLLNTSSTNGAQNNTFLDSSTNNFTITRNGNTTQGTFTPFSQTGWSNRFNGTTDFLSLAASTDWQWPSVSWTVEMWVFNNTNTNYTGRTAPIQIQNGTATTDVNDWSFGTDGNGNASFYYWNGSAQAVIGSTTIPLNTWTHIAATYDGSSAIKVYVNGVLDATGAKTGTPVTSTKNLIIGAGNGAYYNGFISNFRRVVGSVVYTGNFTPSTTPLTAITNTQILTCQSNRFIDNSTNAYPLTTGGTPSVQAFSPFLPTAAYDTAVVGGSGYVGTTGSYLTVTSQPLINVNDWTVEFWMYPTQFNNNGGIFGASNGGGTQPKLYLYVTGSNLIIEGYSGGFFTALSTPVPTLNQWTYVSVSRSSSTGNAYLYYNGVLQGSAAAVAAITGITGGFSLFSNGEGSSAGFYGYMSNVRVSNTARYTGSSYSVPTSLSTSDGNTTLLVNAVNSGIYDSTAKNVLETVGNAQVSTTQAKWGTTSMYFDGTGDNLYTINPCLPRSGDFTLEMWIYPTSTAGYQLIYSQFTSGSTDGNFELLWDEFNEKFNVNFRGSTILTSSSTYSLNAWHHLAIVRSGSTFTMYVDGASAATATNSDTILQTASYVGTRSLGDGYFAGYIDDLRITRGYARYSGSTYTVPTAAFPLL
jgi:hypothetical protein